MATELTVQSERAFQVLLPKHYNPLCAMEAAAFASRKVFFGSC